MIPGALYEQIDPNRLPRHIAIIMDGNGRWARKHFMPRVEGHRAGVKTVDRIVTLCREIHIEALTLYSFSDENWKRPASEIKALMKILDYYLKKELDRMKEENIRFNTIGRIQELPADDSKPHSARQRLHRREYGHGFDSGPQLWRAAGNSRRRQSHRRESARRRIKSRGHRLPSYLNIVSPHALCPTRIF